MTQPSDEFVQAEIVSEPAEPIEAALIAPPTQPSFDPESPHGAARAGKQLVLRPDAILPDRCIYCNKPAEDFVRKVSFYWHPPAYYLLILPGLLIYAIVALAVRKKIDVFIPSCPEHRRKRRSGIITAWCCAAAGVGAFFLTGMFNNGVPVIIGLLLIVAAAVIGVIATRSIAIVRIDKEGCGTFKGAGAEFLDSLKEAGHRLDGTRVPPL